MSRPVGVRASIEEQYRRLAPESARVMERATRSMPWGISRTLSWFDPYPLVFDRGEGAHLYDVDGNRYIDLFSNGLSLMHGHAYDPIEQALRGHLSRGTAWPGTSDAQIEFAELLCERLAGAEQVRFVNTGTEATMLAVKLARHVSGHELIVKAWHGYHGSYDDLEVGLLGRPEVEGRVALADFGDLDSYAALLSRHSDGVAAIVVEPVQYTGVVTPPPDGFLPALAALARDAGVLFVLDDCLMFRLAPGGSAERYQVEADITCLGKWIGGGLPVGAIAASAELMSVFAPAGEDALYHGGSFNGNPLGMIAGQIAVSELDAQAIGRIEGYGELLRTELQRSAEACSLPVRTSGVGSAFGLYVLDAPGGEIDWDATKLLHLAAVTRGVYYGSGGEFGLCTALSAEDIEHAAGALAAALGDVARSAAPA
ncbi:MAG: aspartate aminotransferase family protein [Solirubrobacteraceae bacterium]